jgi:flagellar biosynthesis protein FlhG
MGESYTVETAIADQAATLRKRGRTQSKGRRSMTSVTRVMSFTSGKGGVGKTHTVLNVGLALCREGRSVLLLDADLGLANIHVMLGLQPRYTLNDLFEGRKTLEEILVNGPDGLSIIPSASGVESMCNLSPEQRMMLTEAVEQVADRFDYLLIDTQAGIGADVLHFNSAASEIVCVINGEPTSLTDAYALIKVMAQNYGEKAFSIIANNVADELEGKRAFARLAQSVGRFLHVNLKYLGFVPRDAAANEAIRSQRALLEVYPSSQAGRALAGLARRIDNEFYDHRVKGGMQFFFEQLVTMGAQHGDR